MTVRTRKYVVEEQIQKPNSHEVTPWINPPGTGQDSYGADTLAIKRADDLFDQHKDDDTYRVRVACRDEVIVYHREKRPA